MKNVEDTAKYWRLRDVWPLLVFLGLLPALLGIAGLADSINKREWFWAALSAVLVAGGGFVVARVLITLRGQRNRTGLASPHAWPRDAALRVQDAIRHDRDIEIADADLARRYVARATWPSWKFAVCGLVLVICAGIPLASVASGSIHVLASTEVVDLLACVLGVQMLLRQYRLRRWVRRHPIPAATRSAV